MYYWLKIGYSTKNYENGYVSINQKGVVTGTVDFSGKVRGQAGKTPVAIKFLKDDGSQPLNNGVYEIVNIIDNKNIVLTSESDFVAETNLQVVILGTVPLGKVFTDAQMEGLYTYDWFHINNFWFSCICHISCRRNIWRYIYCILTYPMP